MTIPREVRTTPMLFQPASIRAIRRQSFVKTQTRRIADLPPPPASNLRGVWEPEIVGGRGCSDRHGNPVPEMPAISHTGTGYTILCPYGGVGDRIRVKETWRDVNTPEGPGIAYRADGAVRLCEEDAFPVEYHRYPNCDFSLWWPDLESGRQKGWRSPRMMPSWAARTILEIDAVRVQRLQDISEEDAIAEGIQRFDDGFHTEDGRHYGATARYAFGCLFEDINGAGSWDSNPFVWALTFHQVKK